MPLSTRIDPLVQVELVPATAAAEGPVKESFLEALTVVLFRAGDKVTAAPRAKVLELVLDGGLLHDADDDAIRRLAAAALGAALRHADADTVTATLPRVLFGNADAGSDAGAAAAVMLDPALDGRAAAVNAALKYAPAPLAAHARLLVPHFTLAAKHVNAVMREHAARGLGFAMSHAARTPAAPGGAAVAGGAGGVAGAAAASFKAPAEADFTPEIISGYRAVLSSLTPLLVGLLGDASADVRKKAVDAAKRFGREGAGSAAAKSQATQLLPPVATIVSKDSGNTVLRAAADRALMYLLQVHGNPAVMTVRCDHMHAATRSFLTSTTFTFAAVLLPEFFSPAIILIVRSLARFTTLAYCVVPIPLSLARFCTRRHFWGASTRRRTGS